MACSNRLLVGLNEHPEPMPGTAKSGHQETVSFKQRMRALVWLLPLKSCESLPASDPKEADANCIVTGSFQNIRLPVTASN